MKASLQTIADEAGVSRTTVSLALRNHPRISVATKTRIRRIAFRQGYRPSPELSRLMNIVRTQRFTDHVTVLGFLHDESLDPRILKILSRAGDLRGYRLDPFPLKNTPRAARRLDKILQTRGIEGLVIHTPHAPDIALRLNLDRYCACALGDCAPALHRVSLDKNRLDWVAREVFDLMDCLLQRHQTGCPAWPKRILPAELADGPVVQSA
ncbi:MAG: LacI family DNA-binding transcriptional regulator [Verrucomicrobia bacterium]|nr:LacI family DNA-binding transcriptional regulator [Verrucomicrobiota bacterium]MCH8510225.1 LacI family DNA-binding transcriptional regulator [Kiritimatiellia bacterium]